MTSRVHSGRRRQEICDRCGLSFQEGFTWPGIGIPLQLCGDCTADIEESVDSYGEERQARTRRLFDRLRSLPKA